MDSPAGLDLVHSFLVVADELNFRRSAERLNVDQSALTRRIQRLEQAVGFRLLERTTREVTLHRRWSAVLRRKRRAAAALHRLSGDGTCNFRRSGRHGPRRLHGLCRDRTHAARGRPVRSDSSADRG